MDKKLMQANDYENILRFLSLIQESEGDYRYRVLKHLADIFKYNNLTFLLVDENGMFTNPLGLCTLSTTLKLISFIPSTSLLSSCSQKKPLPYQILCLISNLKTLSIIMIF
mgnify:CR=1 FL=1